MDPMSKMHQADQVEGDQGQEQQQAPAEVLRQLREGAHGNPIRQNWEIPVRLHDGRWVGSWSEDWRLECEARYILRMPKIARREALDATERVRGREATNRLRDRILAIHRGVAKGSSGH